MFHTWHFIFEACTAYPFNLKSWYKYFKVYWYLIYSHQWYFFQTKILYTFVATGKYILQTSCKSVPYVTPDGIVFSFLDRTFWEKFNFCLCFLDINSNKVSLSLSIYIYIYIYIYKCKSQCFYISYYPCLTDFYIHPQTRWVRIDCIWHTET